MATRAAQWRFNRHHLFFRMTDTASYIETLKELQECLLEEENLEMALNLVQELLSLSSDELPPTLVATLQETQLKLLLHLERFQELLEIDDIEASLKSYAYYRLHQYSKSKALASECNDSILAKHVLAQSLYRLHQPHEALDVYKSIITTDDEEELIQVQTNALAVAAAHAIPHVAADDQNVEDFIDTSIHNSDYLYNLATYQVLTGGNARQLLQQAREACDDEESDVTAIDMALHEWSLLWNDKTSTFTTDNDDDLPESIATIRAVNQASSLKALSAIPCNSSWTALQQRLYHYKKAILQLSFKKFKDCKETISLLRKSLSQLKKNAPPPVSSKQEETYWNTRLDVLEAHLLYQQDKRDDAVTLLQSTLASLQESANESLSPATDYSIAYCMLQLHALQQEDDTTLEQTIDLLQGLPESIRTSRAVTATLVSLYQQVGDNEKATSLLSSQEGGMAEYFLSTGQYEKAAKLYEKVQGKEAEWVVALSYVDPEKAQQVWNDLNLDDNDDALPEELNGEELEKMDLPRVKSKRTTTSTTTISSTITDTKPKRSHDAILRRRARKRETYLQQHPNVQEKKLDPERWLPKYERSYYRKRRGIAARGAQGGGTGKDAAKLDVAARASGSIVDSGPSTAHVSVAAAAASGKRSGRRR